MIVWLVAVLAGVLAAGVQYGRSAASASTIPLAVLRGTAAMLIVALLAGAAAGRGSRLAPDVALDASESWLRGNDGSAWKAALDSAARAGSTVRRFGDSLRAGVVAICEGEPTIAHTLQRYAAARDYLVSALARMPRIDVAPPAGAMYAFFRVDGVSDSLAFCKRLVREARLGLAPGSAFGPEGEGFVRWCFASSQPRLADGVARLEKFLA